MVGEERLKHRWNRIKFASVSDWYLFNSDLRGFIRLLYIEIFGEIEDQHFSYLLKWEPKWKVVEMA